MYAKVECGIWQSRRHAHGSTLALVPESIAKAKEIVLHQNLEPGDDGHMGHINAEQRCLQKVSNDL
jgi:hypothetical protein